jgi:YVTN family beta-propeller protein
VTSTIDLAAYAPGPLVVELTPDRKKALVSVSSGFFSIPFAGTLVNATDIPAGPGTVLFLDVETGQVEGQLATGDSPMGITFTPDGSRAYVAHFTSGDLAVVDVAKKTVLERIKLGVYPEEIVFDDSSTVGVIGYSSQGSVAVFPVGDPKAFVDVPLQGDSAGLAFFPGTKVVFVVQAPNPISPMAGFTVIDVSNPAAPRVLQDERLAESPIAYPAVQAKARNSVLVPATVDGRLVLREYKLEGERASLSSTLDIAEASLLAGLGVSFDEDHTVLIAWPATRALVAVDLAAKTSRVIPWLEGVAGPADVVIR